MMKEVMYSIARECADQCLNSLYTTYVNMQGLIECVRETMGLMTEIQKVCIYIGNRERDRQTQGILMHVRERGKETGKRDRPFRRRYCKGLRSREFAEFDTEIDLKMEFLWVSRHSA